MSEKKENWFSKLSQKLKALKAYLFSKSVEEAGYNENIKPDLSKQIWPAVKFGLFTIAIGILVFVVWGGSAPLDSAAIAQGYVKVGQNHKIIQHLEGGVVEKILVDDGDTVTEGQELMVLNSTAAKSNLQNIRSQLIHRKAVEARLLAEEKGLREIEFDPNYLDPNVKEALDSMQSQKALFEGRRKEIDGRINAYEQQIIQRREEIKGIEAQLNSIASQLVLIEDELKDTESLYKKGLAEKTKLMQLQRAKEDLVGRRGDLKARIAAANESIAEIKLNIINIENTSKREASTEYKEVYSSIVELKEKLGAAEDVLKRTVLRAPTDGVITNLEFHTIGGVVPPGGKIMEIVPQNDKLIVEARVAPQDIDNVYVGLKAKVQIDAFKSRIVPRVEGKVVYVSADRINDPNPHQQQPGDKTGGAYYLARVEISEESLNKVNANIKLYPGMPVTVFIVKGTRTFLQYLISPIRDSFHRAFKEK